MSTNEIRSYVLDLEIREDDNGGRTIYGIAVPYDKEQRVGKDTEVFRKGAFAEVIKAAHRVKLLRNHDSKIQ